MVMRFGILVFPNVQQLDLTAPYEIFASARGCEAHLVWKDRRPLASSTGLQLTPTATFDDCPPLDVLCVPGGTGVNPLLEDAATLDFLRRRAAEVRLLTSVCTGSLVLGAAGLLEGRKATSHWNALDLLKHFGAIPTVGRIVRDGALITAGGVTSGIDFGLAVIAELLGRDEAETVQLVMEYAPAPPFHSGLPQGARPEILAAAKNRLADSRHARERIVERLTQAKAR
ncbi:DJ-1/PfpI family protein [Rhodoblastus acidophilus]|uniref:DJ-1/PfpI family protein n=1 Tax=Candidatus Rhodoblastus alkanivorans TaxID=2954117 RepID=A0ABS9Z7J6_9HYPH|nr:DJ-1/PfpI family protein [Candidatus Rhodoblastus alkanivorans]MCI4680808.1 DJ-1/PfpI family protein [Candidatus Rhodoblastus alkanivorans]MCI4683650.1 DJ-1/PfpI family protein [Candidatus Rhodoblastus alkanivorans]MDI4640966.1 DJ-1/PfpI family protein [Rhodoblastus acidophilus]